MFENTTKLEILTVQDVADRFHVSKSSVYEWTRFRAGAAGRRIPVRKLGKYLRFVGSEVDEWFLSLPHNFKLQPRKWIRTKNAKLNTTQRGKTVYGGRRAIEGDSRNETNESGRH